MDFYQYWIECLIVSQNFPVHGPHEQTRMTVMMGGDVSLGFDVLEYSKEDINKQDVLESYVLTTSIISYNLENNKKYEKWDNMRPH